MGIHTILVPSLPHPLPIQAVRESRRECFSLLCRLSFSPSPDSKPSFTSPFLVFLHLQGPGGNVPSVEPDQVPLRLWSHYILLGLPSLCTAPIHLLIRLCPPHPHAAATPEQKVCRAGPRPVSLCMSRASTEGPPRCNTRAQQVFAG